MKMKMFTFSTVAGSMKLTTGIVGVLSSLAFGSAALAGDPPQSPPKTTAPIGGGYIWTSPPPKPPENNSGGSIGLQYPPDKGATRTYCNGKPC
jgi:hypothetical protein